MAGMSKPSRLFPGGSRGNEHLTAVAASLLLVLLFVEGATLLHLGLLLNVHVLVGVLLLPIVALKLASTGWRMLRYYLGSEEYVRTRTSERRPADRRRAADRPLDADPVRDGRRAGGTGRDGGNDRRASQGELHRLAGGDQRARPGTRSSLARPPETEGTRSRHPRRARHRRGGDGTGHGHGCVPVCGSPARPRVGTRRARRPVAPSGACPMGAAAARRTTRRPVTWPRLHATRRLTRTRMVWRGHETWYRGVATSTRARRRYPSSATVGLARRTTTASPSPT